MLNDTFCIYFYDGINDGINDPVTVSNMPNNFPVAEINMPAYIPANVPTTNGLVFKYWYNYYNSDKVYDIGDPIEKEDFENYTDNSETEVFKLHLAADWRPCQYKIKYYLNEELYTEETYDCVEKVTLYINDYITQAFGEFIGWNTKVDGSGTWYYPNKEYDSLSNSDGDVVKLYAQFTTITNPVRITYNNGDQTYIDIAEIGDDYTPLDAYEIGFTPENGEVIYRIDEEHEIVQSYPLQFALWIDLDCPDGDGGYYGFDTCVLEKTSYRVEAVWDPDTPFIIENLPEEPTRNGYVFTGWKNENDEIIDSNYEAYNGEIFYATWSKEEGRGHFVTFNINAGEIFSELPEGILNEAVDITSTRITLELWPNESDYSDVSFLTPIKQTTDDTIFFGWYDSNGVKVYGSDGYAALGDYWYNDDSGDFIWNDNGDVDLYSRFEIPQEYVITFDSGEGLDGPTEQTYIAEHNDQLTSDMPYRIGYVFLYWTDAVGNILYPGDILSDDYTSDFTLYACWDPQYYNISFNANGGTNTAGGMFDRENVERLYPDFNLDVSYQEDISHVTTVHDYEMFNDMSSNIPTRDYYEFIGWHTYEGDSYIQVYDKEGHYVSGDYWTEDGFWQYEGEVVLFALWNPLSFKVTFNANGGVNEDHYVYDETGGSYGDGKTNTHGYAFYGESLLYHDGTPTRKGYIFQGWYDEEDNLAYNEYGERVEGKYWSEGYWIYPEEVTLYAKWLEIEETYENNIFVKDEANIYHGKIYALTNSGYVIGKIYVNINGEWKLGI